MANVCARSAGFIVKQKAILHKFAGYTHLVRGSGTLQIRVDDEGGNRMGWPCTKAVV